MGAHQLIFATFRLYWRYPVLFLVLAAAVIVPYQLIVLAVTGTGTLSSGSLSAGASFLLSLLDWSLITPLVSALHVHAVGEVREGRDPRLGSVAIKGLRVLPVVAAATIASTLGIFLGFLAFVIPGIFLLLRWFVVAQSAAIEHEGWLPALRRSRELTDGHYGHVFVFSLYLWVILFVPFLLLELAFDDQATTAASFLVGLVLLVITQSFAALATALLYYDLRARFSAAAPAGSPGAGNALDQPTASPKGGSADQTWNPADYSDHDRPPGWYVDPSTPNRMRYWGVGDPPGWGATTRTPRKIRRAWSKAQESG
jgi:hypothetical protein